MDRKCCKSLCRALREANVRKSLLLSGTKDVVDRVGNVMESELIDRKVPELRRKGRELGGLFGILVASVVAELEGEVSFAAQMHA